MILKNLENSVVILMCFGFLFLLLKVVLRKQGAVLYRVSYLVSFQSQDQLANVSVISYTERCEKLAEAP